MIQDKLGVVGIIFAPHRREILTRIRELPDARDDDRLVLGVIYTETSERAAR